MAILQYITVAIQFAVTRLTKDALTGTLISAHYLGIFLVAFLYILFNGPIQVNKFTKGFHLAMASMCLWFSDAKHIWILFIFCIVVSKVLKKCHVKKQILITGIGIAVIIPVAINILSMPYVANFLKRFVIFDMYAYNANYNKKFVMFQRMYEQMNSVYGLFGFGLGQFGSQISITLSKGIIYEWNLSIQRYSYAITQYADCVRGLMTEWYTRIGIPISSMVLGYPLVSFVGLFGELGIIGYIWLLKIFEKVFKNQEKTFMIFFFMLTIFDMYFEIPCVLVMLLFATSIATNNKVKKKLMRICMLNL